MTAKCQARHDSGIVSFTAKTYSLKTIDRNCLHFS